jgi:predicted acyl esterase
MRGSLTISGFVSAIIGALLCTHSTSVAGTATPERPYVEDKTGTAAAAQLAADKDACLTLMSDYSHESVMVPMRDGVRLCTEIFLPKGHDGPLPVVLESSPYSRWDLNIKKHLNRVVPGMPVAVVLQNQRGRFGSEGAGTFKAESFENEIDDTYDTLEWISRQPWCNGKIGMIGVSGSGMGGANAVWSGSPHLSAVNVSITSDNAYDWIFSNGVRRANYGWLTNRGVSDARALWPRPITTPYDVAARKAFITERAAKNQPGYTNTSGWYDIFSESLLDAFAVLAPYNGARVVISPDGHGAIGGDLVYPKSRIPDTQLPTFKDRLSGDLSKKGMKSELIYYLMGDTRDTTAPGNIWKVADQWPVPNVPTPFYLHEGSRLSTEPPIEKDGSVNFVYDPKNPTPTLGGNWQFKERNGPHDQRPLKDRADVLRFISEPLKEPVGITGKVWVELYISSDAPDTTFVATLVDIYPDGYEALVRQGAMMARYWQGLAKPERLEKGKIYKLEMDLWSTALVFNKGHRIGVLISSSSSPAFEVHPNTYDPVTSIEQAVVAHQTIQLSSEYPSRIILPIVAPDTYLSDVKK